MGQHICLETTSRLSSRVSCQRLRGINVTMLYHIIEFGKQWPLASSCSIILVERTTQRTFSQNIVAIQTHGPRCNHSYFGVVPLMVQLHPTGSVRRFLARLAVVPARQEIPRHRSQRILERYRKLSVILLSFSDGSSLCSDRVKPMAQLEQYLRALTSQDTPSSDEHLDPRSD